ncbi:hypothetical protein ACFL27_07185 [candidate division CSSED10-310 bacterium]|uniref:Mechanosensitive ion channel n=1 Tax=candidate division CSSED10-310 bacterium TaxID=2855610 RepID=A0ABV6YUR8_UNCC1
MKKTRKHLGQRSEIRGQRSVIRDQGTEVRGQRSEISGQRSVIRDQGIEVRGLRSEISGQRSVKLVSIFLCSVILIFFSYTAVLGQTASPEPTAELTAEEKETAQTEISTFKTLFTIMKSLRDIETQLNSKKRELKRTEIKEEKQSLTGEIVGLNDKMGSFESDFEKIAAGVDLKLSEDRTAQVFDWQKELQDLLGPLIRELKGMTERPRQIEKLRSEYTYLQDRLNPRLQATENIKNLIAITEDEKIFEELEQELKIVIENELREELSRQVTDELKTKIKDEKKLATQVRVSVENKIVTELPKRVEQELPKRLKQEIALAKKLNSELIELEKKWEEDIQQISSQIAVITYQLEEKSKEKKSVLESAQNLLRVFFKSRGRNLIFSVFVFILVLISFRLIHRVIYKVSPFHQQESRSLYVRAGDVFYHILTFLGAISAALVVLYVSGDWVLLIVTLLFLFGIAWAAKQGLPKFWEQIKLLMNLGTVRENERLIYNGVPWRVASLNIYTLLENPEFKLGQIRLPLQNLLEMNSRPFHDSEPWFPCKEEDWVLLSDETFGKVLSQSPDMVQLELRGGSRKTFLTEEFLRLNPQNLSTGFRLREVVGIDYAHQRQISKEIPELLAEFALEALHQEGYGEYVLKLRVRFKEAASSSLNLVIIVDFSGQIAECYNRMQRILQRIAVDACNKYDWQIPFPQLTIHKNNPENDSSAP